MMHKLNLSVSGLSILMALGLAVWEVYFFIFSSDHPFGKLEGTLGWFTPDRVGFNMAWLVWIYLSYQLISIPFSQQGGRNRFISVVDGMASIIPLGVAIVVVFGKSELLKTSGHWEAAILVILVTATDLFGGYAFNIALSRRTLDVGGATAP
jgi:hypothetical protein